MSQKTITHVFFDLYGTLINSSLMYPCYAQYLGIVMAERYGKTPQDWAEANLRVVSDWDSYYADLDLEGDNGMEDMWEGMFRTTRALFRLTGVSEPDKSTLTALARELPELATQSCDAAYPEARTIVERLHAAGFVLGVTSHAIYNQARGTLRGSGLLPYFTGPIISPDKVGQFAKDANYFAFAAREAGAEPQNCVAVDDTKACIWGAKAAGMRTVQIYRKTIPAQTVADLSLVGSLDGLTDYLGVNV